MAREDNELLKEQQAKLEKLRIHFPALHSMLLQRGSILPIIASLSATMLVVFTFNKELIPITKDLKLVLITLLILIPTSVLLAIIDLHIAISKTVEAITDITGIKDLFSSKTWYKKLGTLLIAYAPFILWSILSIAIAWIIYIIVLGF